uniref:Secreted protein n=1 Tax=Arundo donax TaxID=35708 RepID=A0A0A9GSR2_ARUDO
MQDLMVLLALMVHLLLPELIRAGWESVINIAFAHSTVLSSRISPPKLRGLDQVMTVTYLVTKRSNG